MCTDEVRRGPARGRGCQSRAVRTGRARRFTHGRTQVDDDQLNTFSCGGGKPILETGKQKNPKVMHAIIDETKTPKTREKQGFGKIAIWFNHQSFCGIRCSNRDMS
jgi:hypothetical protein